jgi:hypothetical protein
LYKARIGLNYKPDAGIEEITLNFIREIDYEDEG